jgi:hypothetical protein
LTGVVCFVTTWVALLLALLVGSRDWGPGTGGPRPVPYGLAPSPTVGVCIGLFGVAPTVVLIVLAPR